MKYRKRELFRVIILLVLSASFVKALDVQATSQNIRSYSLPFQKASIRASYNVISKNFDIFGIRDDSVGSALKHGNIGDLNGLDLTFGYGLYEHISLIYNFEYQKLDYAGESLKNKKHDLFTKLMIYHNPSAFIDTFSTDLGFIYNSASDLKISGSNLGISKMSDMSDNSFYIRLLAGSKIRASILDFYLGLKYTKIDTKLDLISHNRNETVLNMGFQYTLELGSFLFEGGYEYIKRFNTSVQNIENSNNVFNLTLSHALSQEVLVFTGLKYYTNQYNGIIPYLYNEKTENVFDAKFGYANIGFVYSFNLEFPNH